MINARFVVIASIRRGAIEPAELLDDQNQAIAFTRWEADEFGPRERVVWRNGEPYATAGKPPGFERLPRISEGLRQSVRGVPMQLDDKSALERERRAGRS